MLELTTNRNLKNFEPNYSGAKLSLIESAFPVLSFTPLPGQQVFYIHTSLLEVAEFLDLS
jgi:hypothetical protein